MFFSIALSLKEVYTVDFSFPYAHPLFIFVTKNESLDLGCTLDST